MMTFREMNLRVFQRRPLPHVFFQPRFEPWVAWHQLFSTTLPEVEGMSLREIYDYVGASMRSVHYYTGLPDPIFYGFSDDVIIRREEAPGRIRLCYETPFGALHEEQRETVDHTWRITEFAAKGVGDLPALRWLLERRVYRFQKDVFDRGSEFIGQRGVPQFWVPKSPYFALAQQWMRYEDFVYALADEPQWMETVFDAVDRSYDSLYEELTSAGCLEILNFGENIAMAYLSPALFERYVLPWYEKRSGQLRDAGIFTHIHIDGNFRGLLRYLRHMPFDGLEALTPRPQGDVDLEEIREHIGNKILLDGIPAVLFLDHHSRDELQECVEKTVSLFHPNLVLGISDELPEAGGQEAFDRLKWVSRYCREHGGQ
jgi:hypothetical protein